MRKRSGKFSNYISHTFVRFALVIIGLMSICFASFIALNIQLTTKSSNGVNNNAIGNLFFDQYQKYNKSIDQIADSKEIADALTQNKATTDAYSLLYNFDNKQQIKSIFVLFNTKGEPIITNLYHPNQIICQSSIKIRDALEKCSSSPNQVYSGMSDISYDNGQETVYLFAKAVVVKGKTAGYILLDLKRDSFDQLMSKNEVDIIALTDRFDNAFYETSNAILDNMGKCRLTIAPDNETAVSGKPYYCTTSFLSQCDTKVYTLSAVWEQNQMMFLGILFLCCTGGLMVLLVLFISKRISNSNAHFIEELLYAVEQCQNGNINYRINSKTFEEFQTLYDGFNHMMAKLNVLIQHNAELMERKRQMEVKQLEEQFNPHFVFNVMETLKYEILIDQKQASKMVVSFAGLMRYSINYGCTQVPLRVDIGYVRDYLILQKMRFNQHLTYSIDIADDLLDCRVPKLIIQPIVENSIVHGAQNVEHININITGRRVENDVEFIVQDNGVGITPEHLNVILDQLSDENTQPECIGLYNAHRVLKLLYGEAYGLGIESKPGKGTKITIRMPLKGGEQDVQGLTRGR